MSNTRRHKLSPLQKTKNKTNKKNLSNFLYITDLDDTIQKNSFNLYR